MIVRRTTLLCIALLLSIIALSTAGPAQWKRTPLSPEPRNPNLYPADANAAEEIRETTALAGKEHKRILLVFGGNWCGDCHALDYAFHLPQVAPLLNAGFIVVHVDIGKYDKNLDLAKKYHIDLEKGVPSIAVLETTGTFLYSTSEFEKARLMYQEDVIQFLNKWKPAGAAGKND